VRIDAGIVSGGGFIQRIGNEYSGILDLKVGEIRITAIAMLVTDPFSFVTLLAIHFAPAIELSFGFTLNGLGGLVALNRRIATDELQGIRDGTAATLLFPKSRSARRDHPDKVRAVFPPQEGSFAVRPSLSSAVHRLVLSLPSSGSCSVCPIQDYPAWRLQVGVPSALVDENCDRRFACGDLQRNSRRNRSSSSSAEQLKAGEMPLSGDLGLSFVGRAARTLRSPPAAAFPRFPAPSELASMRRIRINQSPAKWLEIYVDAYFAITANSIQLGGGYHLHADVGVAEGAAWITVDALFKWAPRFYFEVQIDAGFAISALGHDFANVDFHGRPGDPLGIFMAAPRSTSGFARSFDGAR
jgi:hypothetical protein